jgi:hypothetical protein
LSQRRFERIVGAIVRSFVRFGLAIMRRSSRLVMLFGDRLPGTLSCRSNVCRRGPRV